MSFRPTKMIRLVAGATVAALALPAAAEAAFGPSGPSTSALGSLTSTATCPSYLDDPPPASTGFTHPVLPIDGFRSIPLAFYDEDLHMLAGEAALGLRWTFVELAWAGFEPEGPADPNRDLAGAWLEFDSWLTEARAQGLNVHPRVITGGNGVAPAWAGRRTPLGLSEEHTYTRPDGTSGSHGTFAVPGPAMAPLDMDDVADFYRRLVARYKPGGTLAQEKGWTDGYGVRVWEVDNEPDAYGLWYSELDDYAEMLTKVNAAIKDVDCKAVVIGPAVATADPLQALLDPRMQRASLEYALNGEQYAIGPNMDVISFHQYESGAFGDQSIVDGYRQQRSWYEHYNDFLAANNLGFTYDDDRPYWHTEGGFDFGDSQPADEQARARWVPQYVAGAMAAGITKVTVMSLVSGAGDPQMARAGQAMAAFTGLVADPLSMTDVSGPADPAHMVRDSGWTYVVWAKTGSATAQVPVRTATARLYDKYGTDLGLVTASSGTVAVPVVAAEQFNEPVYVVEVP